MTGEWCQRLLESHTIILLQTKPRGAEPRGAVPRGAEPRGAVQYLLNAIWISGDDISVRADHHTESNVYDSL